MSLLSYALCSVDDVRDTPGVDASLTTGFIERKINQATEIIEGYCQRRFASTTYTDEEYDGTGELELILRQRPVSNLASISARDTVLNQNSWDTIPTDQYFLDSGAGIVRAVSSFYGRYNRWKVTYTAGYSTIPADLREACASLAAYLCQHAASMGQSIKRMKEGMREIEYNNPFSNNGGSLINDLGLDEILARYADTVVSGGR